MKVYEVWVDKYDYDEFNALVVIAENKDRVLDIIKNGYWGGSYFYEHQGEVHIEEADLTKECILLESFNAG